MDLKNTPNWLIQRYPTAQVVEALGHELSLDDIRNASRRDLIFEFGVSHPDIQDRSRLWSAAAIWSLKLYSALKAGDWPVVLARHCFNERIKMAAAPVLQKLIRESNGAIAIYESEIISMAVGTKSLVEFDATDEREWAVPMTRAGVFDAPFLISRHPTPLPVLVCQTTAEGSHLIIPVSKYIREVNEKLRRPD